MSNKFYFATIMFLEMRIDGFLGGLSAANYIKITGAPISTTTRVPHLVELAVLRRTGERKVMRY